MLDLLFLLISRLILSINDKIMIKLKQQNRKVRKFEIFRELGISWYPILKCSAHVIYIYVMGGE